MRLRDLILFALLAFVGYGLVRIAAIAERLEPQVTQALDDFHAIREQVPALKKIGEDGVKAVREFSIFRQQEDTRRVRR